MDLNSTGAENTANHQITFQSDKWTFNSDSGQHEDWNKASTTMLAYCFHSVTGYSKFGSYTGKVELSTTNDRFCSSICNGKKIQYSYNWVMFDNTKKSNSTTKFKLGANLNVLKMEVTGNLTHNSIFI